MSTTSTRCPLCKSMVLATSHECQTCGFPVNGSSIEKEDFKRVRAEKRKALDKAKTAVTWARSVLALMTFFSLIVFVIILSQYINAESDLLKRSFTDSLITTGAGFVIYLGLTILSIYKPYPAIVAGFALFALNIVVSAVLNPATLTSGLFMKGLIIAAFIKGTYSVATMENLDQELDHWKKK